MGEQTGKALWARASLWKSAVVIAPLAGAALFLASGTQAQTSGNTTPPAQAADTATVAPNSAPAAARRGGPKGGGRDKELVGITATPAPDTQPAARRKEGPKGAGSSDAQGRTEATPAPDSAPAEGRKKGPKGDVDHGRTESPATTTPNPSGERAIRKNIVPKATSAKSRGSNLLLPVLGGAAESPQSLLRQAAMTGQPVRNRQLLPMLHLA
jgi:hypothetical protein